MSDLSLSVAVSRDGMADLELEDPAHGYAIVRDGLGLGAVSWRRTVATSPFTHGEVLIGAVRELMHVSLGVRVTASSQSELDSRIATLLRAFEAFAYSLDVQIGDATHTVACEPADYHVGDSEGVYDALQLIALTQVVRLVVPRHPIPSAGSF